MKHIICIISIAAALCCAHAQNMEVPEWTMTIRAIDEQNQPVTNATVKVAWHIAPSAGQTIAFTNVSGVTDGDGVFAVHERSGSIEVMCQAEKAGYYPAGDTHEFAKFRRRDPAKWNPTITLLLKKVGTPIPMYAKAVNYFMPTNNKPVGFDLMLGDWTEPYGKGQSADLFFTTQFDKRFDTDYDYKFAVSFPNQGDGIQGFGFSDAEETSDLRSPHQAPTDGYEAQLVKLDSLRPGQPSTIMWDDKTNYFFRVRTVLDEQGKVRSALYGKIYGDFNHFRYYLDPTPNDRNIEFDPKQNLLGGLKSFEQVNAP